MRSILRAFAVIMAGSLAACAQNQSAIMPTPQSQQNATLSGPMRSVALTASQRAGSVPAGVLAEAQKALAQQIATHNFPRAHVTLKRITAEQKAAWERSLTPVISSASKPMASAAGESGGFGFVTSNGGPYTGIYAVNTIDPGFSLPPVSSAAPSTLLVMPTLIPPNGGCFVTGSLYFTSYSGGPTNGFAALDECGGGNSYFIIDYDMYNNYITYTPQGPDAYLTVTLTLDQHPSSKSVWYVALFNYTTLHWDLVTADQGYWNLTKGRGLDAWVQAPWSSGPCPSFGPYSNEQTMYSANIALYDAGTHGLAGLAPTMSGGFQTAYLPPNTSPVGPGYLPCFVPDADGNYYYQAYKPSSNSFFVTDYFDNGCYAARGRRTAAASCVE